MTASIRFDQVGISAGVDGKSRSDGLSTGALVTVTNVGGGACTCEFLWKPLEDTTATLIQVSPTQWQFTPEVAAYGDYIIRLTETATDTVDDKAFGIRLPNSGLLPLGLNARGSNTVHLNSSVPEKALAALTSTHNETVSGYDWLGWWPFITELYTYVENLAMGGGSSTAYTEVIWRPSFGGSSSTVFGTFAGALTAALQATGYAKIILDASLSSTFTLPNAAQNGQSRVLIEGPRRNGDSISVVFDTNTVMQDFTGMVCFSNSVVTLSAAAAGTFFENTDYRNSFEFAGNIARTGAGNRQFWTDSSSGAASSVPRILNLYRNTWTGVANMFATVNALTVNLSGPDALPAFADTFTASGSVALVLNVAAGTGFSSTNWASWTGAVTVNRRAVATSIATDSPVSGNWPEGSPAQLTDAINKLAARVTVVETFVNPLVFNRDKWMFVSGGAGTLTLTLAGGGHSTASEVTIRIWIPAASTYTALAIDGAFGQDGNPVADFDASKGYHVYITRATDGVNITFAVTGKVVTS